jgi:hypothetical protein
MADDRPAARRPYATALGLQAVSGAAILVGYGLVWARVEVPMLAGGDLADGAVRVQEITGRDLYPGAAGMGWLALAAVAGVIATRSWGRLAVAVIGAIAGATGASVAIVFGLSGGTQAVTSFAESIGGSGDVAAAATPLWVVAFAGGLGVLLASVWTAVRGRGWPAMGRRYERSERRGSAKSAWDALDQGEDPTDDLVE